MIWSVEAFAQLPVEVQFGNNNFSFDLMFFKFFKNSEGKNSEWLFFNRNRAVIEHKVNNSNSFGFTEAISFNHPSLKGFAPVAVGQIFNNSAKYKAGVQYYKSFAGFVVFTWLVYELKEKKEVDLYSVIRFNERIFNNLDLFAQIESANTFLIISDGQYSLTQRIRLGLSHQIFQYGLAIDLSQSFYQSQISKSNYGIFLRYDFN